MKVMKFGKAPRRRIYLIAPRHPLNFWTMQKLVDVVGAKILMPCSSHALLIGMTPSDVNVEYVLGDENIAPINWDMKCDLVAITGFTVHLPRIEEISRKFKERHIPVALGGPHASLNPKECKDLADYLFIGEAEKTWPQFLKEWTSGSPQPRYHQSEYVDLKTSPPPDWTLFKATDYLSITIQSRRGCPHNCDFCDVIRFVGRKVRCKSVDQVMNEVKRAHKMGADQVFFTDDNFITRKGFTKDLLRELIKWNTSLKDPLAFIGQTTVEVSEDEELLQLLADARFYELFIGVESIRQESLEEVKKYHNLRHNLVDSMRKISSYGIIPIVGLMVGFDNDDITIFEDLKQFIHDAKSPITCISIVNAPRNTPLFERLKKENRVVGEDFQGEWQLVTNIVPKLLSIEELTQGYHKLFKEVYELDLFEKRLVEWLKNVKYTPNIYTKKKVRFRGRAKFFLNLMYYLFFKASPEIRSFFFRAIKHTTKINPKLMRQTINMVIQFFHFYDFVNQSAWQEKIQQFGHQSQKQPEEATV